MSFKKVTLRLKISLLVLAAMGVMSGIAIVASLPLIAHHFHTIEHISFLSKLLLTIPSIFVAVFAPIAGHFVDKIGRLKPLYLGVFLFVVGGSSGYYIDNFYIILIGRAILGMGVALVMTASMALIGDYFEEEERHKFISLQGMVVGLSGIVFIVCGGYLAEISWHYPFLIYVIPLFFLPLLLKSLKEPRRVHVETTHENDVKVNLIPVYLTGFFSMLLFYMLPTQIPYLVINHLHGTPSSISYFIAFAMLINAIVAKQYHHLKARLSFSQIFVIIYLFFTVGLFIISQVTSVSQLFFSSIFMGVGFGLVLVNVNMWLLSLVHAHKRGRAVGLLTSSFFFGQFFSPIVFEPIVTQWGIQGLFLIISIVSLIIAMTIFLYNFIQGKEKNAI